MTGSNTRHFRALDAIFYKLCILINLKFTVFPTEQMCISSKFISERSSYIAYVVDKPLFDLPKKH